MTVPMEIKQKILELRGEGKTIKEIRNLIPSYSCKGKTKIVSMAAIWLIIKAAQKPKEPVQAIAANSASPVIETVPVAQETPKVE